MKNIKQIILVFIIGITAFLSCKKDNNASTPSTPATPVVTAPPSIQIMFINNNGGGGITNVTSGSKTVGYSINGYVPCDYPAPQSSIATFIEDTVYTVQASILSGTYKGTFMVMGPSSNLVITKISEPGDAGHILFTGPCSGGGYYQIYFD